MKKRKLLFVLVLAVILIASSVSSFAAPAVNVVINDKPVEFTESSGAPFIDANNRTLVPLRAAMEAYGCDVTWDKTTRTATVIKDGVQVDVPIGQSYVLKDGVQVPNDTEAVIINSRTYIPIRVVLESFGAKVEWDNKTRSVIATSSSFLENEDLETENKTDKPSNYISDEYTFIEGDLKFLPKMEIDEKARIHVYEPADYRFSVSFYDENNICRSNNGGFIGIEHNHYMNLLQSFGWSNESFTISKMVYVTNNPETGERLLWIEKPIRFEVVSGGTAPDFNVKLSSEKVIVTLVNEEFDTSPDIYYYLKVDDRGFYPISGDKIKNNQLIIEEYDENGVSYADALNIVNDDGAKFALAVIKDVSSNGFTTTGVNEENSVELTK